MLGGFSGIWQWVIILAIVLLLFGGRGKISALMGDLGKGLRSFKKNVKEDSKQDDADDAADDNAKRIEDGSDDAGDAKASGKEKSDKKSAANG